MITNNDIRRFLKLHESSFEFEIDQVTSLSVTANSLMFINRKDIDLYQLDQGSINCVYLVPDYYEGMLSSRNEFIRVPNPKFQFCRIVEEFNLKSEVQRLRIFREERPLIDGVIVGECCKIGEGCSISPGVILGGEDFSPVLGKDRSELIQFPQIGGVIIGDNVVIKYNTMIGRGTFHFTRIGSNTMIDYGCQIGHNCIIGKSCIIAAGTIIGGSTEIGDCTTIGIGAKIRNGIKIGSNVSIGMGSVVIKDIPDGCTVVGNPARVIKHGHIFDERGLV